MYVPLTKRPSQLHSSDVTNSDYCDYCDQGAATYCRILITHVHTTLDERLSYTFSFHTTYCT